MGDSICDFTGAKTIEECNILAKNSLKIFPAISRAATVNLLSDATTNALAADDPADVCDVYRHEHGNTKVKQIERQSRNLINEPRFNPHRFTLLLK